MVSALTRLGGIFGDFLFGLSTPLGRLSVCVIHVTRLMNADRMCQDMEHNRCFTPALRFKRVKGAPNYIVSILNFGMFDVKVGRKT